MTKLDLITLLETLAPYDDLAIVMVITETGLLHSIDKVSYEPQSTDEDGNITSTGSTIWLGVVES